MISWLLQKLRSPENPRVVRRSIGRILTPRLASYLRHRELFATRTGLELGGPSEIFGQHGLFPIYPLAARIDNCNFNSETVWQGQTAAGNSFRYDRRRAPGQQFFAEATELAFAAEATYDFVLSSHMLEHTANPLKALLEWQRVLKPGGALFIALPHKDATFDHRRPVTSVEHIRHDFEQQTDEHDLTHLPEILRLHDLSLDPGAGSAAEFAARGQKNFENRCLHHHVFDTRLAAELMDLAGVQILTVEPAHPCHIAILAITVTQGRPVNNSSFLSPEVRYRRRSPFPSDRADHGALT